MNKNQYNRWLLRRGFHPTQIKLKKKILGNPNTLVSTKVNSSYPLANSIPPNGLKNVNTMKLNTSEYAIVPAYNKGPVMLVSKDEIRKGAGRKYE